MALTTTTRGIVVIQTTAPPQPEQLLVGRSCRWSQWTSGFANADKAFPALNFAREKTSPDCCGHPHRRCEPLSSSPAAGRRSSLARRVSCGHQRQWTHVVEKRRDWRMGWPQSPVTTGLEPSSRSAGAGKQHPNLDRIQRAAYFKVPGFPKPRSLALAGGVRPCAWALAWAGISTCHHGFQSADCHLRHQSRRSCPGLKPATVSSNVSRRAILRCGSVGDPRPAPATSVAKRLPDRPGDCCVNPVGGRYSGSISAEPPRARLLNNPVSYTGLFSTINRMTVLHHRNRSYGYGPVADVRFVLELGIRCATSFPC